MQSTQSLKSKGDPILAHGSCPDILGDLGIGAGTKMDPAFQKHQQRHAPHQKIKLGLILIKWPKMNETEIQLDTKLP